MTETTSDPREAARALAAIRRPVAGRTRLACVLGGLGAVAGLAPFVGLVELADALLSTPSIGATSPWWRR
ncbi:hypothetical protein [Pseudonocardia sp. TRM90224]|uniref:hypothetical protein n=1 Tax=Pseudonocardia sp. TRM90224 TaxID=2812678 RepID=UPI001E3A785A|nr:hypothetical protein [Pseudonocardia sp. TRM90224]